MGAVIGYFLLLVFVLVLSALMVAGATWVIKKLIYEIKLLDSSTLDEVKERAAEILSTRSRNRGW